ncbi:hypothetical protein MKW98_020096, partial [Papaver atlanticum]
RVAEWVLSSAGAFTSHSQTGTLCWSHLEASLHSKVCSRRRFPGVHACLRNM